jgi:hypothetical protein
VNVWETAWSQVWTTGKIKSVFTEMEKINESKLGREDEDFDLGPFLFGMPT